MYMPSTWNDTIKWTKPIICHYLSCSGHVYVVGVCVCLKTVCLCGADVYWFSQRLLMASNECHWFRQSAVFKWVARTPQRFDCCKHIGYRQEFSWVFFGLFWFFYTSPTASHYLWQGCGAGVEDSYKPIVYVKTNKMVCFEAKQIQNTQRVYGLLVENYSHLQIGMLLH